MKEGDYIDLNLSYVFEDTDTSEMLQYVNECRTGLLKEIIEYFGYDMGPVENKYTPQIATFDLDNKEEKEEIDFLQGIMKYAKIQNLDFSAGSKWVQSVMKMADWYVDNVTTYNQRQTTFCDLVGRPVRHDCSGFVTACLWLYGALTQYTSPMSSSAFTGLSSLAAEMKNVGFVRMKYNKQELKPFDIMTYSGHVEIYAGFLNNSDKSYSWGKYHSSLPCGMANKPYEVIWRNRATKISSQGVDNLINNQQFTGAGAGLLPVPNQFYSDDVLIKFITRAEGKVGLRWVTSNRGGIIATRCGIDGWDFPGGVHSPEVAKAIGVSSADFATWVSVDYNSGFSRKASGSEVTSGAAWGWATTPLPENHVYWKKLLPYYRDNMIWAWHQPEIQAISSCAERLARMHTINWYSYHYMTGLTKNDIGWAHRLQAAKEATTGMGNFA